MAEESGKVAVKSGAPAPVAEPTRNPFDMFRREVDRLFDDWSTGSWDWPFGRRARAGTPATAQESFLRFNVPAVDVVEKDKAYEITAELPGIDEKNVEVSLVDDVLTIRGEKSEEKEQKEKDYHLSERRYGSFQRSFRLPDGIDAGKIDASFKNGVLSITVPKSEESQRRQRKIEIRKQ